jgi:nitroreductase
MRLRPKPEVPPLLRSYSLSGRPLKGRGSQLQTAIFYLADVRPILESFGNRGYRAVQIEAGILGGKLYLAAYAQHLGATGLTFFDDDVIHSSLLTLNARVLFF